MSDQKESGLMQVDGETLIKIHGFKIGNEILLSDSDQMGDYEKVVVKIKPSLIKYWLEDCQQYIEKMTGFSIFI